MNPYTPTTKEKIGAVIAYMTAGLWGFVWLLISRRPTFSQNTFVIYNCYQSILLGLIYSMLPSGALIFTDLILNILEFAPFLKVVSGLVYTYGRMLSGLIKLTGIIALIYCAFASAAGKYPKLPYISGVISRMLR